MWIESIVVIIVVGAALVWGGFRLKGFFSTFKDSPKTAPPDSSGSCPGSCEACRGLKGKPLSSDTGEESSAELSSKAASESSSKSLSKPTAKF